MAAQNASHAAPRRRRRFDSDVWVGERSALYSWFGGVTYEWHFPFNSFGGALEKPVRPIYGMHRFRGLVGFELMPRDDKPRRFPPRLKVSAWLQATTKSADSADCGPGAHTSSLARPCAPAWGFGADLNAGLGSKVDYLGVYARFFHGQDYYNLSFTHRKDDRFQLGLSFTPGRSRAPSFPVLAERVEQEEQRYDDDGKWPQYRTCVRRMGNSEDAGSELCAGL
jgi:hypothetical protein